LGLFIKLTDMKIRTILKNVNKINKNIYLTKIIRIFFFK